MINIVIIADRSGSMVNTICEARNAINKLIDEQKKSKAKCSLTFIMFDDEYTVVIDKEDLSKVEHIGKEYRARGMTALLDAMGKGINHIGDAKKAIITIVTDGYENASQEYTKDKVAQLIEDKKKLGWEFQFIGANMDAVAEAHSMNIDISQTVTATPDGVRKGYAFACSNVTSYVANNS